MSIQELGVMRIHAFFFSLLTPRSQLLEKMEQMEIETKAQHQDEQPGLEYKMDPQPIYIRDNYQGADKLQGKIAVITGGDSGIGRAVAIHFAREGADLALFYHPREEQDAQKTKSLVEAEGRQCLLVPGDLKRLPYIQEAVDKVVDTYSRVNILVNNAANHVEQKEFTGISDQQMRETFELNILAMFRLTKAFLPYMAAEDCIINTTSVVSYRGSQALIDYASTKGAVTSFTRSLSQNLVEKNIRVNAVAPGPIWTPLIVATKTLEEVENFGKDVPMERAGQPAELAPAYVFLASEDASYFTGQVIHVNGGEVVNS
ncbi:NAD(P)-dependent dehydrogenase, short-chain alcohol dehydrogenase family [Spirosoma fluviale]|uniref:NAD(P)-dependent dehydrogenase, short-chain alcohol dehydrogenase family n=2 Tax=Spirosoma fluviale TaxID=1597977 RepID=A0A286F5N7_9BACT|nr:NAD(P)-dependent dehydrogenase, short-chain alcohol dehydrogenase family [Spirosoma fluviale]